MATTALRLELGVPVGIDTGLRVGSRERARILTALAVGCAWLRLGVSICRDGAGRRPSVQGEFGNRRVSLRWRELLSGLWLSEALLALDEVGGLVAHVLVLRRLAVADDGGDDRAEHRGNDE